MQGARETEQSGAVAKEGVTEGAADQVSGVCGDVAAFVILAEGGHFRRSHEGAVSEDEAFDEPSGTKDVGAHIL